MAEEKVNFFHKILIVVVMIYAFSKLSKFNFSSLKEIFETIPKSKEPVRTTRSVPAPQPVVIREYIQVPVQMPPQQAVTMERPRASSQSASTMTRTNTNPSTIMPPNKIHVDDATFRRLFG